MQPIRVCSQSLTCTGAFAARGLRAWMLMLAMLASMLPMGRVAQGQGCQPQWMPGDGLAGVYGAVFCSRYWDPDGDGPIQPRLILGGVFTSAGTTLVNNIVAFDPQTNEWSALGEGLNGQVLCIEVMPNGDLIAGGAFTTSGETVVNRLARWDGTQWTPFGSGMNRDVRAIAFAPNGDIVAGGAFDTADGVTVNKIARWNGTTWSALANGVSTHSNEVLAIVVTPSGDVIAGGNFGTIPSGTGTITGTGNIARFDGTNWFPIGEGNNRLDRPVRHLALSPEGDLLAAGDFDMLNGGLRLYGLARWDGTAWSAVAGPGFGLNAVTFMPDGVIWAGTTSVARLDGSGWTQLPGQSGGGSIFPDGTIRTIAVLPDGQIFAGGTFNLMDGIKTWGLARWNGTAWVGFPGTDDTVEHLAALPNGDVVASGLFTQIGGVLVDHIARWDGLSWHAMGDGFNDSVLAICTLQNGDVVAAGSFTASGSQPLNRIARWDGSTWTQLGTGLSAAVQALAVLPNGDLVAGGSFAMAGDIPARYLARRNGSTWSAMSGNFNQSVTSLVVMPNGDLIAAGNFTAIDEASFGRIARWDGTRWYPLGTGATGTYHRIYALAATPTGDLIAGGAFYGIGGASEASGIARWNGSQWSSLGGGVNTSITAGDTVRAIIVLENGQIVAGGSFHVADHRQLPYLVLWNGVQWDAIGESVDDSVTSLVAMPNGDFCVGGAFQTAGPHVSVSFAHFSSGTNCCPECAADYDQDGGLTGADIGVFLEQFDRGFPCADVDQDGGISGADLGFFFTVFEAGGC